MIRLNLDNPTVDSCYLYDGWLTASGWVLSNVPISDVTVKISDFASQRAAWGIPRPDVALAVNDGCHAAFSGFLGSLDLGGYPFDAIPLEIAVQDESGDSKVWKYNIPIRERRTTTKSITSSAHCLWCRSELFSPLYGYSRGSYRLHICSRCETGFVLPVPDGAFLKAYYDNEYWQNAPATYARSSEHRDTDFLVNLIRKFHPKCKDLVEIGCGPGLLLNGLQRHGFNARGYDLSARAAALAREVFGLDVTVGSFSELEEDYADCVLLRHVLEHSPSPISDLESVIRLLRPGGLGIIISPNFDSLASRILGSQWEWFVPPTHLNYFSAGSFEWFARAHGLELLQFTTRRGDGVRTLDAVRIYMNYNRRITPHWKTSQVQAVIDLLTEGAIDKTEEKISNLGLGNELLVLLRKPG